MILSLAALASGVAAIFAHYRRGCRRAFLLLKPLTTLLILCVVVQAGLEARTDYALLTGAGLLCALVGDVLLMFPERHFARGVLSFAVTHLLYLLAFSSGAGLVLLRPVSLPFAALAGVVLWMIWDGVRPRLKPPIVVYVALITAMVAQAAGAAVQLRTTGAVLAAAGAALFFASDAVLAVNRFRRPFVAAQALVLFTYWAGQWLIAWSTRLGPP